jgi:hypothetical protein
MTLLTEQTQSLKTRYIKHKKEEIDATLINVLKLIRKLYLIIQFNRPVIGTYIEHQVKHPINENEAPHHPSKKNSHAHSHSPPQHRNWDNNIIPV